MKFGIKDRLGIKDIDEQHKKIFDYINELYDAINTIKTDEEIKNIITRLEVYKKIHFKTEEDYFKKCNYKDAKNHIKEHKKFSKKIANMKKNFVDKEMETAFQLADFLEDWILNHIEEVDRKYVDCIKGNNK